jgi:glycosyltransferase involved in cell wall biosynthesis
VIQTISNAIPLVSVIIPLYNGGKYIESTLMSVLSQTFNNYEILVVNDGSTDDGPKKVLTIIEKYPGHIQLISHSDGRNHGIAASRNLAIKRAQGMWIAFIDQDDLWLPEKLEKQMRAVNQFPEADIIYGKVSFIDDKGGQIRIRGMHTTYGKGVPENPQNIFKELIQEDFIPNLTVLVRKRCIEKVGLLDEGPHHEYEDWLLLSKISFYYKFLFLPELLGAWRLHDNNYSEHIFKSGQFCSAEEHCTITLFSFLLKESGYPLFQIKKYLHRRIWRFFLRARSWGVSMKTLKKHMLNFLNAFPSDHRRITIAFYAVALLPPKLALIIRRIRRHIVGM